MYKLALLSIGAIGISTVLEYNDLENTGATVKNFAHNHSLNDLQACFALNSLLCAGVAINWICVCAGTHIESSQYNCANPRKRDRNAFDGLRSNATLFLGLVLFVAGFCCLGGILDALSTFELSESKTLLRYAVPALPLLNIAAGYCISAGLMPSKK